MRVLIVIASILCARAAWGFDSVPFQISGAPKARAASVDTTAPDAPSSLTATMSYTWADLDWPDSAAPDHSLWEVEYKLTSEPTTWTATTESASSLLSIFGLTESTSYDFRVRDIDTSGNPSTWTTVTASTTAAPTGSYIELPQSTADHAYFNCSIPSFIPGDPSFNPLAIRCDDFEDGDQLDTTTAGAVITCNDQFSACCTTDDPYCAASPSTRAGLSLAANDGYRGQPTVSPADAWNDANDGDYPTFTIYNGTICGKPGHPQRGWLSNCSSIFLGDGIDEQGVTAPNGSPKHGKFYPSAYHDLGGPQSSYVISFMFKADTNPVNGDPFVINNPNVKGISLTSSLDGTTNYFWKLEPNSGGQFGMYLQSQWGDDSRYPAHPSGWTYNELVGGTGRVVVPHFSGGVVGNWYAVSVEFHIQTVDNPVNHGSNGIARLYVNNCGADGLGCPCGTPRTLIGEVTDADFGDPSERFWQDWIEWWENNRGLGGRYVDQIAVATAAIPIQCEGNPAP